MRSITDDNGSIAPECTEAPALRVTTNSNNWFGQEEGATRSERQIGLTRLVMKVRVRHIAGDMLVWSKVCSMFNSSPATHLDEPPESGAKATPQERLPTTASP